MAHSHNPRRGALPEGLRGPAVTLAAAAVAVVAAFHTLPDAAGSHATDTVGVARFLGLYVALPWAFAWVALGMTPGELGLSLGPRETRRTLWASALAAFVVAAALGALLSRVPSVHQTYPIDRAAFGRPWGWAPVLGLNALRHGGAELFFRGFVLFALGRSYGSAAVAMQVLPFALVHTGRPELEALATLPAGVLFGVVAWRTRSALVPWVFHWTLASSVNLASAWW